MQPSRGQPPHGADPSSTDRSHSHTTLPSSFHTSESLPSSPPFFSMNPLTDQRLTGPMMSYQPVDHHSLSRYVHIHTLPGATVDDSPSCHAPSQHIDLSRFCIVAVCHAMGLRSGRRFFLREPVFHPDSHPQRHGLAQPRGQLLRATFTAPQGGAYPQSLPRRYSSVRLFNLSSSLSSPESRHLAYVVYFPTGVLSRLRRPQVHRATHEKAPCHSALM